MSDRPNVLLVLTDQYRAQALGCMGNAQVDTPNLDRIAAEGLTFENAYSSNPVCSPARGSIQTGCYSHRHRVIGNTYKQIPLPTEFDTLGECMHEARYRTGYIGKWHLDGTHDEAEAFVPPERRRGYEYWRGFDRGHYHMRGHPFFENGEKRWEEGYQPAIQTDLALDFLDSDRSLPWFLFLSWGPPHSPFEAPEQYHDRYDPEDLDLRSNVPAEAADEARETLADYYACITALDDQVGRLLDALDDRDLTEDTVVLFTADHGEFMGSHGQYGKGSPLEEASNVPLLVRYPRAVDAGERTETFANLNDLLPTLLSLCDVPIPETAQGQDLSCVLRGEDGPRPTSTYLQGGIAGDNEWRAVRTERYLFAVERNLKTRYLFDMAEDPYQRENLAADPGEAPIGELQEAIVENALAYDDRAIKRQASYDFAESVLTFEFDHGRVHV
ncbi:MAG: sulfatase [Halobacteriales archaeon]